MPDTYGIVMRHLAEARAACRAEIDRLTADLASAHAQLKAIDEALAVGVRAATQHGDTGEMGVSERTLIETLTHSTTQHGPEMRDWAEKLQGLTQPNALIRIAEERGGTLRHSEATRILLEAGLIKGKRANAASHLYRLLKMSDRFEWVSPGTFKLVTEADTSAARSADAPLALGPVEPPKD